MGINQKPKEEEFLPTPSARRATLLVESVIWLICCISTHALREEGD